MIPRRFMMTMDDELTVREEPSTHLDGPTAKVGHFVGIISPVAEKRE